jgi:hypothetical protein
MAAIFELSPPSNSTARAQPSRSRALRPVGRGRIVRRRAAVVTAAAAALLAGGRALPWPSSSAPAEPRASGELVVVGPGDTLWSIAEEHFPVARRSAAIEALAALNGSSADLRPGEIVALPSLG